MHDFIGSLRTAWPNNGRKRVCQVQLSTVFRTLLPMLLVLVEVRSHDALADPLVIPAFQKWTSSDGLFELTGETRVVYNDSDEDLLLADLNQFRSDLQRIAGVSVELLKGTPSVVDISVTLDSERQELGQEGYELRIGDQIHVTAYDPHGAFYGMQSLLQLFAQSHRIEKGVAIDFPSVPERGFMIDCGRHYFEIDYLEDTIRRLAWLKLNFIHLHLTEWNGFRIKSDRFPGLASEKAYSKEDLRRIQDFAAKYHVAVVPEIDLPAHATHITDFNPDLAFQCKSMRRARWQGEKANNQGKAFTLDISRPEVREWIRLLLDEMIPLFDGPYFHIGGDEWQYDVDKYACPDLMAAMKKKGYTYPCDLFVEWINEANEQVKAHGKTTQIWNWWRFSPNKEKQNRTSIQPAKDIVINIWNRPRRQAILQEGYRSIITTEEGLDALYVTPFEGNGKVGDYGVFNSKYIYGTWEPSSSPHVLGFKVCLWCDRSEHCSDQWFNQYYELPLAIVSQRTWGSARHLSFDGFEGLARRMESLRTSKK